MPMKPFRTSGILPLLMITIVCAGVVEGGYQLFEHLVLDSSYRAEISIMDTTEKRVETKSASQKKIDYRIILQRNLFGHPPAGDKSATPPASDKMEPLTATSLAIVLMGTVIGSGGTERAIILDQKSQKQDLYEKGDAVQGALIKEIARGKVILAKDGGDEILDMSEAAKVRQPVPVALVPTGQSGTPSRVVPRPTSAIAPATPPTGIKVPAQTPQVESARQRFSREAMSAAAGRIQNSNSRRNPQRIQGE